MSTRKDHWSSKAYTSAAGFVPKMTTKVVGYLDPQPTDKILDIGCGDAQLTAEIAKAVPEGKVLGVDASQSFITTAKENHSSIPNLSFILHDATDLQSSPPEILSGEWDKVFSNAAMHWILKHKSTRLEFFSNIHRALKPHGKFVFEMGGKGNVAEIQAATIAALVHAGIPIQEARDACPWFFPSSVWMENTLRERGFEVEVCETEYRPSALSERNSEGSGGIEGWVRLMCAQFLEVVPEGKREAVIREICEVVETVITREEDGGGFLGYVRLRAVARKM
ncbi:uncharacterized protein MYCFIDRAFT_79840 [Pseudocercospora fijiensis CIRAD86]|uniref:Methyltransferase domain-containing protein n=1 Tax=Pseudocercospora fijiensis (strain CIRAD86) TaxID=383855 RepID=M2ZIT9_PSEFD|nr:uncharacterized protein MYCFIDRAFT_79840 [Pseudocercospora fijiensis CIRAD86]EME79029.1 hypothetical protein MYCFIDRAFT_79840 [Pseudocercospora fijiensis CIRAD86]